MDLLILIVIVFFFFLFASSVLSNQKKQLQRTERLETKLDEVIALLKETKE